MELVTFKEIAEMLDRLSEPTIRRYIRESRAGRSSFPLPITAKGKKALWHRSDIENWRELSSDIPAIETPVSIKRRVKAAQNGLANLKNNKKEEKNNG